MKRRWRVAVLVGICLLLAGCGSGSGAPTPVAGATALLDTESGEIVMPLDPYVYAATNERVALFSRVLNIAIGACMVEQGYIFSAAAVPEDPASLPGDRPFGVWNLERVRVYGSGVADSAVATATEADREAGGPNWEQAQNDCFYSIAVEIERDDGTTDVQFPEEISFLPTNADYGESLGRRLSDEAAMLARGDERWEQAAVSWNSCMEGKGLEPPKSVDDFNLTEGLAMGSEEDLRVSLIIAACDQESGRTQTLGNIEAEYQAALMERHEAALAAIGDDIVDRVAAAEDYIAQHG